MCTKKIISILIILFVSSVSILKAEEQKFFKFEFGCDSSIYSNKLNNLLFRSGFTQISNKSVYDKNKGYGWKSAINKKYRICVDTRKYYRYGLFNLTRKTVWGPGKAQFIIDLPNGKYAVYWLAGFSDSGIPTFYEFDIYAEGIFKDKVKIPFRYLTQERIFEIDVKDGQLNIDFVSENAWWLINALIVFPCGNKKGMEEVEKIRREIFLGSDDFLRHWQKLEPKITDVYEPEKSDIERGHIIFTRSYMKEIYPASVPQKNEIMKSLSIFMTPGEYEPLTFSIRALKTLKNVNVSISDLISKDGVARIPKENVDIRLVWCTPHAVGPNKTKPVEKDSNIMKSYMIVPDMLVKRKPDQLVNVDKDEGVIIKKNETLRYWLTVKSPEELPAGKYSGKINISFSNCKAASLPVSIKILPFKLKMPDNVSLGGWFGSVSETRRLLKRLRGRNSNIQEKNPELFKKLWEHAIKLDRMSIKYLKEHNCDVLFVSSQASYTDWESYELITPLLETHLELAREFNFKKPVFLGGIEIPGYRKRIPVEAKIINAVIEKTREELRKYKKMQKERDWPDIYYYATDEPNDPIRLAKTIPMLKMLNEEGIKSAVAAIYPTMKKIEPYLNGIKYYCLGYYPAEKLSKEIKKDINNQNWIYANYYIYYPWRQASRFVHGFYLWKFGFNGYMNCTWNNTWLNPYNELQGRFGDAGATNDLDGPVPVVQWEAAREGIDDIKYIHKLETLISEGLKNKNPLINKDAEEAKTALHDFKNKIELDILLYSFNDKKTGQACFNPPTWKAEYYDENRKVIANYALRLHSLLNYGKLPNNELTKGKFILPKKIEISIQKPVDRKITSCVYKPEAPLIDGKPGDTVWRVSSPIKDFMRIDNTIEKVSSRKESETTKAYTSYDDTNLYLCIICYQKDMQPIKDQLSGKNSKLWENDRIEIFIDPDNDMKNYFQFAANPAGKIELKEYENHGYTRALIKDYSNDAVKSVKLATTIYKDSVWVMEIAIPFRLLDSEPVKDEKWGLTIGRYHLKRNRNSSSCGYFHRPEEFGFIMFEN